MAFLDPSAFIVSYVGTSQDLLANVTRLKP
jgi:hypothetical protein